MQVIPVSKLLPKVSALSPRSKTMLPSLLTRVGLTACGIAMAIPAVTAETTWERITSLGVAAFCIYFTYLTHKDYSKTLERVVELMRKQESN